jgi:hypothetical protein
MRRENEIPFALPARGGKERPVVGAKQKILLKINGFGAIT